VTPPGSLIVNARISLGPDLEDDGRRELVLCRTAALDALEDMERVPRPGAGLFGEDWSQY
jgi:hypothetical protein